MITSSTMIREARKRANLTQSQLAARSGIAQSVVSAYESRRREPSVETLRRIVQSAGFDLTLALSPAAPSALRSRVQSRRIELVCALRSEGARSVSLFGSVARGEDGPGSDIDLLIDVDENVGLFALGRMRASAERILESSVDIVPANSLKADVRAGVLTEAVRL